MRSSIIALLLVLMFFLGACFPSTPVSDPGEMTAISQTQTAVPVATMWARLDATAYAQATMQALAPTPTSTPTPACALDLEMVTASLGIPESVALDYPRVDNSTSAQPLQMLVACRVLGVSCAWREATDYQSERLLLPVSDVDSGCLSRVRQRLWSSGTHDAYVNLIAGDVDFILVARLPSEEELQQARESGVTLEAAPVALDAFVFLVHVANPIDSLSVETIRRIYTGEITSWARAMALEGQEAEYEGEIQAYQRDENSGSQELMEGLVMQGAPMADLPNMILNSMVGPISMIGGDPLREYSDEDRFGIGYSVYYYATYMFPHPRVRLVEVDGVLPTTDSIADGSYPLVTEVYAVVRGNTREDTSAIMLRDWLLTEQGQAVVAESGYVPIHR